MCGEPVADDALARRRRRSAVAAVHAAAACYLLFTPGRGRWRYRAVPDRYLSPRRRCRRRSGTTCRSRSAWRSSSATRRSDRVVAFYPSPAGATESRAAARRVGRGAWRPHPALATLQPDVEALLVRVDREQPVECYLVPIDVCYELVGQLRRLWRGFDGGRGRAPPLDAFFADVRGRPATRVAA